MDDASYAPSKAWAPAAKLLVEAAWRRRWRILLCGATAAAVGMGLRLTMRSEYVATEQLLFDPQGLKVFASDGEATRFDVNAQIDFVESQMGVLLSERVLSRLLLRECAAGSEAPPNFAKHCADGAEPESLSRAIDSLRQRFKIKRGERSFLVDVAATGETPEFAARLATDLVEAYVQEDAANRKTTAASLNAEIDGRIATLKGQLTEQEKKAETFRREADLTAIGDKLLVEMKLHDAAAGLTAAEERLQLAQARVRQLAATPQEATSLGALGSEAETRPLAALLDRRAAARADLAPLAARLGARNPDLIQARSRLAEVERDVSRELEVIRAGARAGLDRATRERAGFSGSVQQLTGELGRAREAQIALQALDRDIGSNRKLVETLESRSREVSEASHLTLANLRIASQARQPVRRHLSASLVAFGALGFVAGIALALGALAALVALRLPPRLFPGARRDGDPRMNELVALAAHMRERAS